MTDTATTPTVEEPLAESSTEGDGDVAIDPSAIKACIDSGRPLKDLIDLGDHVWETMYDFGFRNYQKGQFEAAEYWWVHTCLFDPEQDRNWISLGMAYQRQQKYEKALNAFSLAAHHGSTNPWVPLHAAECHLRQKNFAKAASALDSADTWVGNHQQQELLTKRIAMLRKGIRKQQERLSASASNADA